MERFSFAGDARGQTQCLLRSPGPGGAIPSGKVALPPALDRLVGTKVKLDDDRLEGVLRERGAPETLSDRLDDPISRAGDNDPAAPPARYFVIHDTSTPNLGPVAAFPDDIDRADRVNDLWANLGPNAVAHLFINRRGEIGLGHDLAAPWRATKFESKVIGPAVKGLFIHVELVQPRRSDPALAAGNDRIAPEPGFTNAQYDALALCYATASVRAGTWLIPAFHADLDAGLADAHDDPQHFDTAAFDAALARLIKDVGEKTPGPGQEDRP